VFDGRYPIVIDRLSSVTSVLHWEVVVSSTLVQQVNVFIGDDLRLVHKTVVCVGLLCSWIQVAAFIQGPWYWLKIYNFITSEVIRWQKGKGYGRRLGSGFHEMLWFYSAPPPTTILMQTGIRFLWGFVVLFSPSTNDDTYGKKLFGLSLGMTQHTGVLSASWYDYSTIWTTSKSGFISRLCPD
jgi:hypothetical protein